MRGYAKICEDMRGYARDTQSNTWDARRICRLLNVIFTKYAYHNDKRICNKCVEKSADASSIPSIT